MDQAADSVVRLEQPNQAPVTKPSTATQQSEQNNQPATATVDHASMQAPRPSAQQQDGIEQYGTRGDASTEEQQEEHVPSRSMSTSQQEQQHHKQQQQQPQQQDGEQEEEDTEHDAVQTDALQRQERQAALTSSSSTTRSKSRKQLLMQAVSWIVKGVLLFEAAVLLVNSVPGEHRHCRPML